MFGLGLIVCGKYCQYKYKKIYWLLIECREQYECHFCTNRNCEVNMLLGHILKCNNFGDYLLSKLPLFQH